MAATQSEAKEFKNITINTGAVMAQAEAFIEKIRTGEVEARIYEYEKKLMTEHRVISESNFDGFTKTADWRSYCSGKYPYVDTLLKQMADNHSKNLGLLLKRLDEDAIEIGKEFGIRNMHIEEMAFGMGDFHSNNNATTIVKFASGEKLVYKPRPVNTEVLINELFGFYKNLDKDFNVYLPQFISKPAYSWHQFIIKEDVLSLNDVAQHYTNFGKLAGFTYFFSSRDIIHENIIATRDRLYLIDVECFFSNNIEFRNRFKTPVNKLIDESILSSGILPVPYGTLNRESFVSPLLASPNGGNDNHLPAYKGKTFPVEVSHIKNLEDGFDKFFDVIENNRAAFIKKIGQLNSANINYRILLHTTDLYDTIRREMFVPEYLNNNKEWLTIIKETFTLENKKIQDSVEKQLLNNDIPVFYSNYKGELRDGFGNKVAEAQRFSLKSALDKALPKIKKLDMNAKKLNRELIRKSIMYSFDISNKGTPATETLIRVKDVNLRQKQKPATKNNLLEAAVRIGDDLLKRAVIRKGDVNWIAKNMSESDGVFDISLLNLGLYDGLAGMETFFYYLYKYTGDKKYSEVVNSMDGNYKRFIHYYLKREEKLKSIKGYAKTISSSPLNSPGSFVYTSIVKDKESFANSYPYVERLLDYYLEHIPGIESVDFLQGLSGLLTVVVDMRYGSYAHLANQPKLDLLIDKMVGRIKALKVNKYNSYSWPFEMKVGKEKWETHLCGFSHGVSGIAAVLQKANHYLKDEETESIIEGALKYEATLYSSKTNGWFDMRMKTFGDDHRSWCHGSGGIALSKLMMLEYKDDMPLKSDLKIASDNLLEGGNKGHGICHGIMSNLEVLKASAKVLGNENYNNYVNGYLYELSAEILKGGKPNLTEQGSINFLGMFFGLSGLGYQLLRFYDWENVPSVICLENPSNLYKVLH